MQLLRGDVVEVRDAPPVPGLRFRRYAGESDLAAIARVHNASRLADAFELVVTPEAVRVELAHLRNIDAHDSLLLAEVDGRLVGVSGHTWTRREDGLALEHEGSVLPGYRGLGIGRAMLRWHEVELRAIADADPGGPPGYLQSWTVDPAAATGLLLSEGYTPVRFFFEMVLPSLGDLPVAELPTGLEIRAARDDEIRRVIAAESEAFRDHWGHHEWTEEDVLGIIEHPEFDPSLVLVAWDGDEIAGVVSNLIPTAENEALGRRRGWLDRVSTRRQWRRKGVAAALIRASLELLRERGITDAALGVDADNPSGALGLYERLGFEVVQRATMYRKPLDP